MTKLEEVRAAIVKACPEKSKKRSEALKRYYSNPENRKKHSEAMRGKTVIPKLYGKDHPQYKHGMGSAKKREPLYTKWSGIKRRCFNKNDKTYARYGAVGIGVSKEWLDFRNFYRDMFPTWYKGATIDRIDNTKGYSRENCRWATVLEQQRNKTTVRKIPYNNRLLTIAELSEITGIKHATLYVRIRKAEKFGIDFNDQSEECIAFVHNILCV